MDANRDANRTCPDGNRTCPNDGKRHESDVSAEDADANDVKPSFDAPLYGWSEHNGISENLGKSRNSEIDSREKLEADLKTHLYEFGGYCFSSREGHTDNVDTFFDDFVFLLDRQAEITANQLIGKSDVTKSAENAGIGTSKGDIRNFDDSYEKLEAEMTRWMRTRFSDVTDSAIGVALGFLKRTELITWRDDLDYIDYLRSRIAELEHLRTELAASNREREYLRGMLGIALDHAHDILALVDIDAEIA